MTTEEEPVQCSGTTASDTRCKRFGPGEFCKQHAKQPAAKKPRTSNAFVPGWVWLITDGKKKGELRDKLGRMCVDRKGDPYLEEQLPFNVVPRKILRDEQGKVESVAADIVQIGGRTRTVEFPASLVFAPQPGRQLRESTGLPLATEDAKWLLRFVSTIIHDGRTRLPEMKAISAARWDGNELLVPGAWEVVPDAEELQKFGDRADIAEAEAKTLWGWVVDLACQLGNHRFGLALGMPVGSLFTSLFDLDSFLLHLVGESNQGKTLAAETGMNTLGLATRPKGPLYMTWNASPRAFTNIAKRLGILPLYLDEAATFSGTPEEWVSVVYELAQGRSRPIADASGGIVAGSNDTWNASFLTTGEMGIVMRSSLTGTERRVLEVRAPLITSDIEETSSAGADSERAASWSRKAHGWPLHWLAADPDPDAFLEARNKIMWALFEELTVEQKLAFVEAESVATCFAGLVTLGRLVGVDVLGSAKGQARAVYRELRDRASTEGSGLAERVVRAIRDDLATQPQNWPKALDEFPGGRERTGVTFDVDDENDEPGVVGILSRPILERISEHDPNTVLAVLRDAGYLVVPPSGDRYQSKRKVWMPGQGPIPSRVYLIRFHARKPGG
jgi:hypothetical protein